MGSTIFGKPVQTLLSGPPPTKNYFGKSWRLVDRYNVVLAATSGSLEHVRRYRQAAPDRILPGLNSPVANLGTPDSLRELIRKGEVAILGEIGPQIEGISPDDEILEPYLALAEGLDIRWPFTC